MEADDMVTRIKHDTDFIKSPKYGNSLNKFLAKVEKIPDTKAIARLLMITPQDVEEQYDAAVSSLRDLINP